MKKRLGVVMDPIQQIHVEKDSTFALLLEAQQRGFEIYYFEQADLFLQQGIAYGRARHLIIKDDPQNWYQFKKEQTLPLAELAVILMRKDPPFDVEYIYTTYLLEFAEIQGTLVVNKPQALRDANEKIFAARFPACCPETLVTREAKLLRNFIAQYHQAVLKPLHTMGGGSIFLLREGDPNINVVIEMLTAGGTHYIMAQRFIPEITQGDKRILLIDGEPIPYALTRIPASGEIRGNLAAGGHGVGMPLTERDYWISRQVGPTLREMGLLIVGLDVIGDYLTEINVTSPTCIRQLDAQFNINISAKVFDSIEQRLS
ncbi:MAG: glutathione synthase [Gammaproteobacteria bacterium]